MSEDLTPLGELLESARGRMKPKLSQNAAAKKAGTSGTTWRRVIKGSARFGGVDVPFEGAPDSIARMALVVGVTPEQLEELGRSDVADDLRSLLAVEPRDDWTLDDARAAIAQLQATVDELLAREEGRDTGS